MYAGEYVFNFYKNKKLPSIFIKHVEQTDVCKKFEYY